MEKPNLEEKKTKPSLLWSILRWFPLGTMIVSALTLLALMLAGGMVKIMAWYFLQLIPPVLGSITLVTVVIYAIIRRRMSKALIATGVASIVSLLPLILWFVPVTYPASLKSESPPATVRLPADVPLRVIWGGNTIKTNRHAAVPDQRWAYDLLVEPYLTGGTRLEDYGCYGIPVVAPIAGYVTTAHDGEPDETPGAPSNNRRAPFGNYIAIRMETGTYLIIAHLKPESLTVEVGNTVEEGEIIGQCGNSGNTSEPHIHIHHQRQDPNFAPINFAEGLPLYFRDHNGPPMPEGGVRIEGDKAFAEGDVVRHIGK